MAIFHVATNTPPKSELIEPWLSSQSWGSPPGSPATLVGSFHLDDPDGQVGMQVFVVESADMLFQVPLTYRASPLAGGDDALIGKMEHSVLGNRYVYDALADDRFLMVLAGVAATGYGQALGFASHEGRWYCMPDELLVRGTGSLPGRIAVDGLTINSSSTDQVVLRNDGLELIVYRRLTNRAEPDTGLIATWNSQPDPVTLADIRRR